MERDPDIAALAARLGLRRLAYRSFVRPVLVRPTVVAEPSVPAMVSPPPEAMAAAQPPVIAVPAVNAPAMPFAPAPASSPPIPPAAAQPVPHFPLLAQALARGGTAAADVPAAAQPFLNLRRAIADPPDSLEH